VAKTPEELLEERKKRVLDAAALKVPDRVPIFLPISVFGAYFVGSNSLGDEAARQR